MGTGGLVLSWTGGYFGKENIEYMDQCGYDFVIMMKGMKAFVRELLLENRGSFENIRAHSIRKYKVSGTTVKRKLYEGDGKERYFHIFYSDQKASVEHEQIEAKIDSMAKYLDKMKGKKLPVQGGQIISGEQEPAGADR